MKLQPAIKKVFAEYSELIQVPAKACLLREGEVAQYLYYIHQGALILLENTTGKASCHSFQFENAFYGAYASLLDRRPSEYSLLALEDCVLERVPRTN